MQLENNRFVEVYGPIVDMNVLDSPNWEFGPMASYRFGRSDVEDPVVNLLPPIDGGLEAGVFAGWHYIRTEGIPYRVRLGVSVTTAISGGATGGHVTPYASLWVPLSPRLFVGVGGGFTWSSESFMQQRFGVSPEAAGGERAASVFGKRRRAAVLPVARGDLPRIEGVVRGRGRVLPAHYRRRRRQPDRRAARRPRTDQRRHRHRLLVVARASFVCCCFQSALAQT